MTLAINVVLKNNLSNPKFNINCIPNMLDKPTIKGKKDIICNAGTEASNLCPYTSLMRNGDKNKIDKDAAKVMYETIGVIFFITSIPLSLDSEKAFPTKG